MTEISLKSAQNLIKTSLLGFIMALGFNAVAQDIILKRDGSEIEAKVIEITDQQIKYKNFDFQSGPIRNVNIHDVFMITYENGQKEVFNEQTSTEKNHTVSSSDLKKEFDRIGDNDIQMLDFLIKNHFTEYYYRFASACGARNTGKTLLGVGIGFSVAGTILTITGSVKDDDNAKNQIIGGYLIMGLGELFTVVSIPVSVTAGVRKREIKNEFAKEHFGVTNYTYQPKLNFGSTQHGVGLVFSF